MNNYCVLFRYIYQMLVSNKYFTIAVKKGIRQVNRCKNKMKTYKFEVIKTFYKLTPVKYTVSHL